MTYHYNNRCKVKNVSCVYCGKKVYSIFIRRDNKYSTNRFVFDGKFIKPRNLKDFYYCRKHGIQRMGDSRQMMGQERKVVEGKAV